jgi:phage replication-related protein YjqB (UPF0714/DUF867 family)
MSILEPMRDTYSSFYDLAKQKTEDVDFQICVAERASPVVIIAPHGGQIEPNTSEIATEIAGDTFSLYCFEGLMPKNNFRCLHITSANFDEPRGVKIVEASTIVIAVHGRKDKCNGIDDPHGIWIGGRDKDLRNAMEDELRLAKFEVTKDHSLPGTEKNNICNRGLTKAGGQLELPYSLRKNLVDHGRRLRAFAAALRRAIECHPSV